MPRATTPASSEATSPPQRAASPPPPGGAARACPDASRGGRRAPASNPKIVRVVTNGRFGIARVHSRLVRSRASYAESHPHVEMGAGEPDSGANPPQEVVGAQAPLAPARQLTPQAYKGELLDARHTQR